MALATSEVRRRRAQWFVEFPSGQTSMTQNRFAVRKPAASGCWPQSLSLKASSVTHCSMSGCSAGSVS